MQFSESNSGQIQINGSLEIDDLIIDPTTLTNTGTITINSGGSITTDPGGRIVNDVSGTIRINPGGSITNSGTVTLKGGFFDNQGTLSGNELELASPLDHDLMIDNGGLITISSHTLISFGKTLTIGSGSILTPTVIHINSNIFFSSKGTVNINSLGRINNFGLWTNAGHSTGLSGNININTLGTFDNCSIFYYYSNR